MKTETQGNMKRNSSVAMAHSINLIHLLYKKRLHEQSKSKGYPMVRKSDNSGVIVILKEIPSELMLTRNLNFILI